MKEALSPDIKNVMEAAHYRPAVSIIMPFEPKMTLKGELAQKLKYAVDKVEKEIQQNYAGDLPALVIRKLRSVIKNLNFATYKKSIAIYVSPVFEKILYLDIPVDEKIIIDESFEIRDLVYAKKEIHKFLLLVLSARDCKVFLGDGSSFAKIKSDIPEYIAEVRNEAPERVANFSDPNYRKEVLLKKFLLQADQGLGQLLQSQPLPVFVLGAEKVLGYFKGMTKHQKSIAGYIHGNYEEATGDGLRRLVEPFINDWKKVKAEDLRRQIEKAADAGKLVHGMQAVWKEASKHKGRLLIVEKNYMYSAEHGGETDVIYKAAEPYNKFSYIKDAVDDVIEKVLENGGDVEFVEEDSLRDFQRIALIEYY